MNLLPTHLNWAIFLSPIEIEKQIVLLEGLNGRSLTRRDVSMLKELSSTFLQEPVEQEELVELEEPVEVVEPVNPVERYCFLFVCV